MARNASIFGIFDPSAPNGIYWVEKKPHSPLYLDRFDELHSETHTKSTVSLMLGDIPLTTIVVITENATTKVVEAILGILEKRNDDTQ